MLSLPLASCTVEGANSDANSEELRQRIRVAKEKLNDRLMILGHHYQRDSIIEHADETGDSFLLALQSCAG